MRIHFIFVFSLLFILQLAKAEGDHAATVIVLKGVAKLEDGTELKLKDRVKEGAKIKTAKQSFIKLLFRDNTQMNLGPNSEMKVEFFKQGKPGLVNVVSGKLRAKVNRDFVGGRKEKKQNVKLMIRSKTAAMGVRGTTVNFDVNIDPAGNEVVEMAVLEGVADAITGAAVDNVAEQIQNEPAQIGQAVAQIAQTFDNPAGNEVVPIPEGTAANVNAGSAPAGGPPASIETRAIPAAELQTITSDPAMQTLAIPAVDDFAKADAAADAIATAVAAAGGNQSDEQISAAAQGAAGAVSAALESGASVEALAAVGVAAGEAIATGADPAAVRAAGQQAVGEEGQPAPGAPKPGTQGPGTQSPGTAPAPGAPGTPSAEGDQAIILAPPGISADLILATAEAPEGVDAATIESAQTSIENDSTLTAAIETATNETAESGDVAVTYEEAAALEQQIATERGTASEEAPPPPPPGEDPNYEGDGEFLAEDGSSDQTEYPVDDETCPDVCEDPNDPFGNGSETTVTFSISVS